MIAQADKLFEAVVSDAPEGLVGTMTVEVYDPSDGAGVVAPTANGIAEVKPGTYRAYLLVPEAGTYRIRWTTPDGDTAEEELTVSSSFVPPPGEGKYPTVDEVGAILRARTQDEHDDEIGTFNESTRPTAGEVENMIRNAGGVVYSRIGSVEDDVLTCSNAGDIRDQARYMVALLAAMLVELSYFPEQIDANRSAFEYYRELWNDQMTTLIDAASECRTGEVEPDAGEGQPGNASWAFPKDAGGMVGWQTRW